MDQRKMEEITGALAREVGGLVVVITPTERYMYSGLKIEGKEAAGRAVEILARLISAPSCASEEYARGMSNCTSDQLMGAAMLYLLKSGPPTVDRRTWFTP